VVAAAVAAAALSCHPEPGLGTLTYVRSGRQHVLDLSTCRDRILKPNASKPRALISPDGRFVATVVAKRHGNRGSNAIVVRNRRTGATRTVHLVHESYSKIPAGSPGPIALYRWSTDGRWLFFAIYPQGSNSIAADGLLLQVISTRGGRPHRIGMTLGYADYMDWCGSRLVFTGGGNRLATINKRLLVASPPAWRARPLIKRPKRAWGSVACAPGGRSVVAQSQPSREDYDFFATKWELWRVGLNGSERRLTSPPLHSADESPRFSRDGRSIFFVRSRRGLGSLFRLEGARVSGPLLRIGYSLGYYGHRNWWLDG
jgi:dipeptidyl aminopeptidase/acylaminoacyl peptidase